MTTADLYLRLSDARLEEALDGREARLRARAAELGWTVGRVVIENDLVPGNGDGTLQPASAYKRRKITTPSGRVELRTIRPGFRSVLDDLTSGRAGAVLAEDLDRLLRQPRDGEDLLDAVELSGATCRSLSGSITLTDGGTDNEQFMARTLANVAYKASADTARRVRIRRADLAAAGSYGGGRRPFGYRPDPDAPKYHKRLLVVPAEAAAIREAAGAIMAKVSLAAIARDWRERGLPSVTGAPWTPGTVRDALTKPGVAGLAVTRQDGKAVLCAGNWEPILDRDRWEALVAVLTAPGRRTTTGNEPRHLCSLWARCHCGAPVRAGGGRAGMSYVCTERSHLRRASADTDALVAEYVIARLERDDAAGLLAPPARPGVDAGALRAEQARLAALAGRQAAMHALGEISDGELRAGSAARKRRLDRIGRDLAAVSEPDPLAEFRGRDPRAAWQALSLPRKREVARLLCRVTLLKAARPGRQPDGTYFDPDSVQVLPAAG